MSNPFYFDSLDAEMCYPLSHHKDNMRFDGVTEKVLYRAKPMPLSDGFWCKEYDEVGEDSKDCCGLQCDGYAPRNGKSGRCRHHRHCYEHGDVVTIKLKDKP